MNNILVKKVKNISKEKIIYKNLTKYNKTLEKIFQNKIKNLMFHKKSHFTAIFTEYLIWDDNQEFLFDLYPENYSLPNLSSYIKIQCNKFFIPIIINIWGRKLLKLNVKMKKLLISQMTEKSKQIDPSKYILKKYSKILPSDLSENISDTIEFKDDLIDGSFKTFKNCCLKRDNNQNINNNNINQNIVTNNFPLKGKEISESESTIDNVNANNDISISLDLKINKKYDDKILDQNIGFVIGKNGKNDEDLLRMMKYLKPINTNHIYQNNKNKSKANYIYLNYVNNKISRLIENINKSSKNKSDNKKKIINNNNNLYNNENLKTFSKNIKNTNNNFVSKIITSKNTSLNKNKNKKNNEQNITISKKINNKLYSKSNNKANSSKNNNNLNNNVNNNNITNGYNDQNNKTTSTKTNSYNISYKNKSENQKKVIACNRNKKNNNFISQHNSDIKIITPFSNESKISQDNGSSKLWKKNANLNSEENSKVQTIIFPQKKIINLKEKNYNNLKTTNNINNINISSDVKKMKFLISSKDENSYINKLSGIKIIKKEKSLDNKPLNNGINKKGNNQILNKKNIIIVKRKISDGINTFHKI